MDSATNHREWAQRSGEFSPTYYAQLGPNAVSRSLVTLLEDDVDEDAAILEVGCSSGRHLAHLHDNGFENLTGVDINDESFDVMADYFPDLAETGTFHTGPIERVVPEFADGAFDVVYSVETLQHVHSDDEWVFKDLARVTNGLLVTAENEGDGRGGSRADRNVRLVNGELPLYRRNWKRIFVDLGLVQLQCTSCKRSTIRAFRKPDGR